MPSLQQYLDSTCHANKAGCPATSPGCPAPCAAPRSPPPAGLAAASGAASRALPPGARPRHGRPQRWERAMQGMDLHKLVLPACCLIYCCLPRCASAPCREGSMWEGSAAGGGGGGRTAASARLRLPQRAIGHGGSGARHHSLQVTHHERESVKPGRAQQAGGRARSSSLLITCCSTCKRFAWGPGRAGQCRALMASGAQPALLFRPGGCKHQTRGSIHLTNHTRRSTWRRASQRGPAKCSNSLRRSLAAGLDRCRMSCGPPAAAWAPPAGARGRRRSPSPAPQTRSSPAFLPCCAVAS